LAATRKHESFWWGVAGGLSLATFAMKAEGNLHRPPDDREWLFACTFLLVAVLSYIRSFREMRKAALTQ